MEFMKQLDKGQLGIQFIDEKRILIAAILSGVLMLVSLASLSVQWLNLGVDFTGGTLIEVQYENPADLPAIRQALQTQQDEGENALPLQDVTVQYFGTDKDVVIRLGPVEHTNQETFSNQVLSVLKGQDPKVTLRRVEFVGPQVGQELVENGGLAMLYTLFGILIYVAVRFEYRFSIGAVLALVHDTVITLGFFSLTRMEFDLTVLAAVLAIIGYSLNDTIVVFDRIRENFLVMRKKTPQEVMNASLNQTLIRTLMTSLTTLLVVFALFILGGELIHSFATALIIGILVGTYSSIYVASAVTLKMGVSKADLLPVQKEGADSLDDRP